LRQLSQSPKKIFRRHLAAHGCLNLHGIISVKLQFIRYFPPESLWLIADEVSAAIPGDAERRQEQVIL
jgi:hypothetical protein